MIRPIVKDTIFLSQKSENATEADIAVAVDLMDTLRAHANECVGMAANMIGVKKRIIVFSVDIMQVVMINPVIVKKSKPYQTEEGCLSLSGMRKTTRYQDIEVSYLEVFEDDYFTYIEKHLRILSGFYGVLKPFDGITPYRLEMQARIKTDFCKNLYDFWNGDIYREVKDDLILNLASEEYAKTVRKYLEPEVRFVDCIFGEMIDGKVKEKGVYVKMARGEMVRFMAENSIHDIDDI